MSAAEPRSVWEQRVLEERARALAVPRTPHADKVQNTERVIVCSLGEALFGIALADVTRVTPFRRPARLPSSDPALLGISPRSGVFYRIYDLTALLQHTPGPESGCFVLLRQGGLGLRVDHALGVAEVALLAADEAPHVASASATSRGLAKPVQDGLFGGRLISLLDISKLVAGASPSVHGENPRVDI